MDSFFRMPQIQKEALSDITTVQVCPISVFPRPVCVGFEWKALCRLQDAKKAGLNSGFILLACPGNHGTHWTQLRPGPGGWCFKEPFASRLKWMRVVPSVVGIGPGCSRFHAVGSPYCRGRMLSTPLYRAVEALCCAGEGPVSYCQRPCAVLPATFNGTLPLAALSRVRGPIKVNTRHPQAGSCCIVHRYQTTGIHPPRSCHSHLPPTLLTPRVSEARHSFDLTCTAFLTSLRFNRCLITAASRFYIRARLISGSAFWLHPDVKTDPLSAILHDPGLVSTVGWLSSLVRRGRPSSVHLSLIPLAWTCLCPSPAVVLQQSCPNSESLPPLCQPVPKTPFSPHHYTGWA